MDCGDRVRVVLGAPGELPVAPAERPRAKADGGEVQVRVAKSAKRKRSRKCHIRKVDDLRGPGASKKSSKVVNSAQSSLRRNPTIIVRAFPRAAAALPEQPAYPLRAAHPFSLPPYCFHSSRIKSAPIELRPTARGDVPAHTHGEPAEWAIRWAISWVWQPEPIRLSKHSARDEP
jgi:hypothetical protein